MSEHEMPAAELLLQVDALTAVDFEMYSCE